MDGPYSSIISSGQQDFQIATKVWYVRPQPKSESSIGVSRETLQRLKEAKPALAAVWAKSGKLLRSDDDAINALMDHFFTV